MAYGLTGTYNTDTLIKHILTRLGVIPAGGTVTADQEAEAEIALEAALHSFDSMNIWTTNTKEAVITVSIGNHVGSLSSYDGIHSVLGVTLYTDSPKVWYPLELVPAQKLGAFGSPYLNAIPTKCCAVLSGQPEAGTNSKLILNAQVPSAAHIDMIYRAAITSLTLDTGEITVPAAYLRIIILMTCVDLASSFGVELGARQELRALLDTALNLALNGAAGAEPTPAMRAAAATQGTVPPAMFPGMGGIP